MKIALAQFNPTVGDFDGNSARILSLAERAREQGADLAVFSELCLCGYLPQDLLERPAFIDRNQVEPALYPKGKVTAGGISDRYLRDYPNMYGDLSAGSGLNALTRDEDHAREFLNRHQDKLLYGSDCSDKFGEGEKCSGSQQLATVKRLVPNIKAERKILYENAARVFKLK